MGHADDVQPVLQLRLLHFPPGGRDRPAIASLEERAKQFQRRVGHAETGHPLLVLGSNGGADLELGAAQELLRERALLPRELADERNDQVERAIAYVEQIEEGRAFRANHAVLC
eukprot:1758886-Pyramimonas_sp.AAC.1